jgi:hypothetical protein
LKSHIYLIFLFLLTIILFTGCINSTSNNAPGSQNTPAQVQETPVQAQETPVQVQASSPKPTDVVEYQDVDWINNAHMYGALIAVDYNSTERAVSDKNNPDYDLLVNTGQNMINDSQNALNDNNKFKLSPKFADAQREWVSCLEDLNNAGNYLVMGAKAGKNGDLSLLNDDVKKYVTYAHSSLAHMERCGTLIRIADGTV